MTLVPAVRVVPSPQSPFARSADFYSLALPEEPAADHAGPCVTSTFAHRRGERGVSRNDSLAPRMICGGGP